MIMSAIRSALYVMPDIAANSHSSGNMVRSLSEGSLSVGVLAPYLLISDESSL